MNFPREIESAMTDAEAEKLQELARNGVVLEIGAWYGFSTIVMARVAKMVHSVDWHLGDSFTGHPDGGTFQQFRENLERHKVASRVVIHLGDSGYILPMLRPRSFDLVFVDGQHSHAAVRYDGVEARQLVKLGGIVAFHDYGRFGVKYGVDEIGLPFELVETLAVMMVG
jgi:predicted O-methyltransferase YrrM